MTVPPYFFLALFSAIAYSLSGLFSKQAMAGGCGLYRMTACGIWGSALLLLPFAFLYSDPLPLNVWYQPLIAAACFTGGQIFFILALRTGDLSIIGPLSGIKPILNALLVSALLGATVPISTWVAAALTALALLVLRTPNTTTSHSFLRTLGVTLLCTSCFALCDTCFQAWAKGWGVLRFAALTFGFSAVAAVALIPLFGTPWKQLPRHTKTHLLTGTFFSAMPALSMGLALGRYGHSPEINVIYSTRALFSIAVVWLLGRHIGSIEHTAGPGVLLRRLAGTGILLIAIVLIFLGNSL